MFRKKTVFVLGAGAGPDIDMPTGRDLSSEIARKVNFRFAEGARELSEGDPVTYRALSIAQKRRKIGINDLRSAGRSIAQGIAYARSIDSYIHAHRANEAIKVCGKIAITQLIVEAERRSKLFVDMTQGTRTFRDAIGVQNSWLHELMYLLHEGVVATDNLNEIFGNIAIINFNYDRCVEQFLFRAIQELYLTDPQYTAGLMRSLKIYHPYGVIAPLPWKSQTQCIEFGGSPFEEEIDFDEFSDNIRTFNEEVPHSDELNEIRESLRSADNVAFMGFHFHPQNMQLIRPIEPQRINRTTNVYLTVLDRSGPDQQIIAGQIATLLGESRANAATHTLNGTCKNLLNHFGRTLAS